MGQGWATDAPLYRIPHPPSIKHFNEYQYFCYVKNR